MLSLDYDLLYRNKSIDSNVQKNAITDLEGLNLALRVRECEIQQSLGSLQIILNTFTNNNDNDVCKKTLTKLRTKYKNNVVKVRDGTNEIDKPINCEMYFDSSGNLTNDKNTKFSSPKTAFKIGSELEFNSVDRLKLRIQEISPYFSSDQYKTVVSDVLNQLSVTLRSPPPSEFSSIRGIIENTTKIMNSIVSFFPNLV